MPARLTDITWSTYKPHLERLERVYASHLIDTILADDLGALVAQAATDAVARRPNARANGRGAKENAIGAYR